MTDAWCPYCDKLRRRGYKGQLLQTCGDEACHYKAISKSITGKRWGRRTASEIDYQKGFASQNLTFAPDRARLRT